MTGQGECGVSERHTCATCDVTYTSRSNLERHVRERHAGQRHVCDRCGATFARRYRLEAHVRTHTGREPFQCSLCPATAASRAGLARHVRSHATSGGGTACPECHQVFRHYWRMKLHRRHHRTARHPCRLCGRLFRNNGRLAEHLLTEHLPPPPPSPQLPPPEPDLAPAPEPELGLDLALGAALVPDLEPGSELEQELLSSALDPASEPPELQIELDPADLEGELGAELAQLLGDGVRMELQEGAGTADEAVMVITLVDE